MIPLLGAADVPRLVSRGAAFSMTANLIENQWKLKVSFWSSVSAFHPWGVHRDRNSFQKQRRSDGLVAAHLGL